MSVSFPPPATADDNPSLVAQMRPALVTYFRRKTGNAAEAEDLAQDVLVSALTHAHWKTLSEAKGYIFRSAINRWRDRRRRQQTHGKNVSWEEAAAEFQTENLPERAVLVREEFSQLLGELDAMNERTQAVLTLIKWEQMRAATVAEMLGISESAVNKHLAKGLARLAELRKKQERT